MDRTGNKRRTILICCLLSAVTLAVYWPVLNQGFIRLDDPQYILKNDHVLRGLTWENVAWSFQAGYASNWHPLTWVSHMLDLQLFGLQPRWHHLVNLVFHIVNAVLLFLVLQRLTAASWRSAFVAALFALHPLHVESVAWIAERKDVLSTFFLMLTLWAYVRYAELKVRKWIWYGLALAFFALGLMSKPMLVTVPFLLLLVDFWPLKRVSGARGQVSGGGAEVARTSDFDLRASLGLVLEKIPFLLLSVASSLATFFAQNKGHAVASVSLPLVPRLSNAIASYLKYLGKMIWPADLAIFYPHPDLRYPISDQWPAWLIVMAALLLGAICVFVFFRRDSEPWLITGWFWYLIALVPVIGIVQVGSQAMADRYTYIPLIGIFIGLTWSAAEVFSGRFGRRMVGVTGVLILVACAGVTVRQLRFWRNDRALFEHALAVTSNNSMAHFQIGTELSEQGETDRAIEHFRAAIEASPAFSDARCELGVLLNAQGKTDEAFKEFLTITQRTPWHALGHNNLGWMLWAQGKPAEAMAEYNEALRLQPDCQEAHLNLGIALLAAGDLNEAGAHFAEAVRLKPDYLQARVRLAEVLIRQGKPGEAEAQLRAATQSSPTNAVARVYFGDVLRAAGKQNDALEQYAEALRLEPNLPAVHINIGKISIEQGKFADAEAHFTEALRLKPDDIDALGGLGQALAIQGKLAEAETRFREVLRLSPSNVEAHEALGFILMQQRKYEEAIVQLKERVRLRPDAKGWFNLGMAHLLSGQTSEAIASHEAAIQQEPNFAPALNDLAWILATTSEDRLRDGPKAVRLAEHACQLTEFREPLLIGTLAAAYAEAGRFGDAVQTGEKARATALAQGNKELAEKNQQILELYRNGKPYRELKNH